MTAEQAPDVGLTEVLVEVLAFHRFAGQRGGKQDCRCGWRAHDTGGTRHSSHVAEALADALAPVVAAQRDAAVREAEARAWDEAAQALAWCLDNGPADTAPAYVRDRNPYRADRVTVLLLGPVDAPECSPHDDLTEQTLRDGLFVCARCGSPVGIEQPPTLDAEAEGVRRDGE